MVAPSPGFAMSTFRTLFFISIGMILFSRINLDEIPSSIKGTFGKSSGSICMMS